jgi:cobalt-zinc-cadmium efflux system outer membrane protein
MLPAVLLTEIIMAKIQISIAIATLLLYGCGTTPRDTSVVDLRDTVGSRAGGAFTSQTAIPDRSNVAEQTRALLKDPLTLDAALRVALLNAPRFRRHYAELAIAAAERAGAEQLPNPVLSARALPSLGDGPATLEFGLLANLVNLLTRPGREHVAGANYDAAKFTIAAEVVAAAQELRAGYIEFVAAQHAQAIQQQLADAAAASAELAARFHDAGNISEVNPRLEQAARAEAVADLAERALETDAAREKLAVLMGIDGRSDWGVPQTLPSMPSFDVAFESGADRRFDVQAARALSAAALAELKYRSDGRLWHQAGLGLVAQREGGTPWTLGPQLELALPIFNQGRPEVAHAAAAAVKADQARAEIELVAASQVRMAQIALRQAEQRVARYRDEILPLRSEIVALKLKEYNRMFIGAFDVLAARKDAAAADLGYVKALRAYWLARASLDTALGGGTTAAPTLVEGASP